MVNRNVVKQIRLATRRKFSADEKIRIVLEDEEASRLNHEHLAVQTESD